MLLIINEKDDSYKCNKNIGELLINKMTTPISGWSSCMVVVVIDRNSALSTNNTHYLSVTFLMGTNSSSFAERLKIPVIDDTAF